MLLLLLIIIAYLIGSLSSAIIYCKLAGLPDPRSQGSGNPGATNVMRMAGKKAALLVLFGDALKGVIPVLVARLLGLPAHWWGWVLLAAFLGHLLPVFFGFRGGKGVATAFGGLLMLAWPLGLAVVATWIIVAAIFRYSSLAAIVATICIPIYGYWLAPHGNFLPLLIMAMLLIIRHQNNIGKLVAGEEDKIGSKKKNKK